MKGKYMTSKMVQGLLVHDPLFCYLRSHEVLYWEFQHHQRHHNLTLDMAIEKVNDDGVGYIVIL